jgi:hypothetical protein
MKIIFSLVLLVCLCVPLTARAANLDYTVDVDSDVVVTGSPRLTLTIGAATQYAVYNAGASTPTSLVFRYAVQAGDFDANGIEVGASIDLNGGTILDAGGNALTLTYAAPVTPNVKVQTYQAAFTTDPITESNETAAAFQIAKAPIGADFDYTITSSGGAGSVTGSGTISADPHAVTGINVSNLPYGTLTVSVTVTNASGTGEARTDDVTGNFVGALDSLNAQAAYSVRKLRSAYTGNALQVRRTSDSTTSNIGFTFAGNLNTASLLTFCAATNCHVATWYDQTGNVRNATQATPANQPRIVNAGVLETQNTRPSLRAPMTTISMNITATGWNSTTGWSLSTVARTQIDPPVNSTYTGPYVSADCSPTQSHVPWTDGVIYDAFGSNARKTTANPATTLAQLNVYNVVSAPGSWTNYLNGTQIFNTGTNTICANPTSGARLFFSIGGAYYLNGYVSEAIIYTSPLTNPQRTGIQGNQKIYFATP